MAIEGGALKANIRAIGPLVLPTWDELLFVLLIPPTALSAEAHHGHEAATLCSLC